jgi:DNA-directed RNA polymerase II subunit RPB2
MCQSLLSSSARIRGDRDIIEHVVYDLTDGEMMDMFRPSLEEAFVIQRQDVARPYRTTW